MAKERFDKNKTTTSGAFVVGQIQPPEFLWSGLSTISGAPFARNGVFIIYSGTAGGRIGVFSNRYITGAIADGTLSTGIEALKLLLAVEAGMFGFRPCLGSESSELRQQLSLDIVEILSARETLGRGSTPADGIAGLALTGAESTRIHYSEAGQEVSGGRLFPDLLAGTSESAADRQVGKVVNPDSLGYLQWLSGLAESAELPQLKEVLVLAMPESESASPSEVDAALATPATTKAYHDGVSEESRRAMDQLEQLQEATNDDGSKKQLDHFVKSPEDRAKIAENLKLLIGLLRSEEARSERLLSSQLQTTLKPRNLMTLTGIPTRRTMAAIEAQQSKEQSGSSPAKASEAALFPAAAPAVQNEAMLPAAAAAEVVAQPSTSGQKRLAIAIGWLIFLLAGLLLWWLTAPGVTSR